MTPNQDVSDPYDEGTELDQEQTVKNGADDADTKAESFLAPKSAFGPNPEVGATHTVTIEAILDTEVQLSVSDDEQQSGGDQSQQQGAPDENASMYE